MERKNKQWTVYFHHVFHVLACTDDEAFCINWNGLRLLLNPHLCLCEWSGQILCVVSRGLGQTRGKSFLPKILHCKNILLKMSLNVVAIYFYNIIGNYMILYVIIMWINVLKSAAKMTLPEKSILNTRSNFVGVGVNLCCQQKKKKKKRV